MVPVYYFRLDIFRSGLDEGDGGIFSVVKAFMVTAMKWRYPAIVAGCLFFVLWLMPSRFGNIRPGRDDERPEFG